jgi:hypothetical protein
VLLMMWPVAVLCAEKDLAHAQEAEKAKATEETKDVLQVQVAKNQTFTNNPTPPGHLISLPTHPNVLHISTFPWCQCNSRLTRHYLWAEHHGVDGGSWLRRLSPIPQLAKVRLEIKLCHSPLP